MYTTTKIAEEIDRKVAWLEENNGRAIHKEWLINAVIGDHSDISGADADFALCCARFAIEQHVDRYFRTIKKSEEDGDGQELLPGFEKLQKRYIVVREDERVIVSIYDMTDDEITSKAEQHRIMGAGHYQHADELERFMDARKQPPLEAIS